MRPNQNRSKTGTKPKLGAEISTRLKQAEGQVKAAAEKLELDYKSLRQDLHLSRFFEADLHKLCVAIGLPTEYNELRSAYDFTLRSEPPGRRLLERRGESADGGPADKPPLKMAIPAVFSYYELRQAQMARLTKSARDDISGLLFKGLGAGDSLFLTIIDELPFHWRGQESAVSLPLVAQGLEAGLRICYLHPGAELFAQLSHVPGARFLSPQEVRNGFAAFRQLLENYVRPELVQDQTVCVEFNAPVLCVPRHRYALYHHLDNPPASQPGCWATVTVPFVTGKQNKEKQARMTILEISDAFRDFLHDFCRQAVDEALRGAAAAKRPEPCLEELKTRLFWRPVLAPP